jgi:hypothetical protein
MSRAPLNGTITLERVRELLSATVASSCLILFDRVVWSTAKQPARKKHRPDRWLSPRVRQRRRRAAASSPADGVAGAIVKVEPVNDPTASAEAMKAKMAAFDVDVDDAAAMTAQLAFAQDKYDEIERLASKLIGLDRDIAHALYKVLRNFDDRCDLMRALEEGLGLDDDTVRRQPKVVP